MSNCKNNVKTHVIPPEYVEAYENDRKYVLHSWSIQKNLNPPVVIN